MPFTDYDPETGAGLDPNSEQGQAYFNAQKAIAHGVLSSLSVAPSTLLSIVKPDPETHIPFTRPASMAYGFGNMIFNTLTGTYTDPDGPPTDQNYQLDPAYKHEGLNLPFASAVEEAGERTKEAAQTSLPPMTPQNGGERMGQSLVDSFLSFGPPGLGGLYKAAPKAITGLAHVMQPGSFGGEAITGGLSAIGAVTKELQNTDPTTQEAPTNNDQQLPIPPIPPEPINVPMHPLDAIDPETMGVDEHDPHSPLHYNITPEMRDLVHANDSDIQWGHVAGGITTLSAIAGAFLLHKEFRANTIEANKIATYESTARPIIEAYDAAKYGAPGTLPTDKLPAVPLPPLSSLGPVDTAKQAMGKAITEFVDKSNTLNELIEFHAPDATQAQILKAKIGLYASDSWRIRRVENVARIGHDAETGVSMPSIGELHKAVGAGSENDRLLYDNASHALDELDNRRRLWANHSTTVPNTPEPAVNFQGQSTAQLQALESAASYNPVVQGWLDTRQAINRGLMDMSEKSGMLTHDDVIRLQAQHPNYMSSAKIDGAIENPFRSRAMDLQSGGDTATLPVWERDKQHFEAVIKAIQDNNARKLVIDTVTENQNRNPKLPKLFEPSIDRSNENQLNAVGNQPFQGNLTYVKPENNTGISIRANGKLEWHIVNNPAVRAMLNVGPEATNQAVKVASMMAQIANSNTTQIGAAILSGHIFAPTQLGYVTARSLITRPKGTATGLLDKGLQHITDGRLALPGLLDPTAALGPVIGTTQGLYSVAAHSLATLMHPQANNAMVTALRNQFGPAAISAFQARIENAYRQSSRYQMQQSGATHASGAVTGITPTTQLGSVGNNYSIINGMAPNLHLTNGTIPGLTGGWLKVKNLYDEMASIIAEGQHTFYYSLNKNSKALTSKYGADADTMLTYHTRNLAGDPGVRGGNKVFDSLNKMGQYGNTIVQDLANLSKAVYHSPFQTGLNVATTMGLPVLASVFSAIVAGPNSVRHMSQELSSGEQSNTLTYYGGDDKPENALSIKIPQTESMFTVGLKQFAFDALDLQKHSLDPEYHQWVIDGLSDLFKKHVTHATLEGTAAGLNKAITLPLPTIAQGASAFATGRTLKVDPVEVAVHGANQQTLTSPVGHTTPNMPGIQPDENRNNKTVLMDRFGHMIAAITGITGQNTLDAYHAFNQTQARTGSTDEALQSAGQVYRQSFKDSFPMLRGVAWNSDGRLSLSTPLDKAVTDSVEKLRPLISERQDSRNIGLTRAHGNAVEMAPNQQAKVPLDPTMAQAYDVASRMGSRMINGPHAPYAVVEDLRKSIAELSQSGRPPDEIRVMHNQLTRGLHNQMSVINSQINDINDAVSNVIGKSTNVSKIDWTKGMEQFSRH